MAHVPATVRRAQIIEAATAVIARDGVAGATTRAIAREAGVTLATLHYVFATKDDVLAGVLETLMGKAKQTIEQSMRQSDVTRSDSRKGLAGALHGLAQTYWTMIQDDLGSQRVQYELTLYALRTPQAADMGRSLYGYYLDAAETLIRDACERTGETIHAPVRDLAHLTVAGIDGILLQNLVLADHEQARRSLDNLVRAVLALAASGPGEGAG